MGIGPDGRFLYVLDTHAKSIEVYHIRDDGAIVPIGSFATGVLDSTSIAIDPAGQFLYVANHGDNAVSACSIAHNGALTLIGAPVAAGTLPVCVAVSL
jgi:6-phosphogluconolactonase (cycloisomerase 2 family)